MNHLTLKTFSLSFNFLILPPSIMHQCRVSYAELWILLDFKTRTSHAFSVLRSFDQALA